MDTGAAMDSSNAMDFIITEDSKKSSVEEPIESLDDDSSKLNQMITIITSDNVSLPVPRKLLREFVTIQATLNNLDEFGKVSESKLSTENENEIHLTNVTGNVMKKVIEFLVYHEDKPWSFIVKPIPNNNVAEWTSAWDAEFVNIPQDDLFSLTMAANYLDIKSLLDLCGGKVASMIKGKNPQQIRETFNIVNDMTPEEEAAAIEETKWSENS